MQMQQPQIMAPGRLSSGFSPLSDETSAAGSSPRSPNRSSFANGSSDPAPVSRHWMVDGHAPRACEKCRLSKRKCDKKLPYCDRCLRLNAKCHYLQDPLTANPNGNGAQIVIFQPQSLSNDTLLRNTDPLAGVTAAQILTLISPPPDEPGFDWRSAVNLFFTYIHPWFSAIHPGLFERRALHLSTANEESSPTNSSLSPLSPNGSSVDGHLSLNDTLAPSKPPQDPFIKEVALLVVAMHLVTRVRYTDSGAQNMFDDTYRTVKRMLALLFMSCSGAPQPSIELVQCGALVALYEYGHGDMATSYRTLSETAASASVLGVKPGLVDPGGVKPIPGAAAEVLSTVEREQRSGLWWCLFILDQFIHKDETANHLPFVMETPTERTSLPEMPSYSPSSEDGSDKDYTLLPPTHRRISTATIVGTVELGSFQLSAKISTLLHRSLRIDKERDPRPGRMPLTTTFADLDNEIRRTTQTMLETTTQWETVLDCFSMSVSALFTLYMPYLPILESTSTERVAADNELSTALAALRFACKMSTDISCKINEDIDDSAPNSLAVLAAPAGATCYYVIVAFAGISRIFPSELPECEEAIAEKFESLRLFSCRWGIAERMMQQLEERRGLDRTKYLKEEQSPSSDNMDLS